MSLGSEPLVLALTVVAGIGFAIYTFLYAERQRSLPAPPCDLRHRSERTPPGSSRSDHPNCSNTRGKKRKDTDSTNCSICSQPISIKKNEQLPCEHSFHSDCLTKKIDKNNPKCPVQGCREPIPQ